MYVVRVFVVMLILTLYICALLITHAHALLGYNPSTSKTLHNSKDTSHLPAGGTIGTRGYAQSKTTTSVTGSTAGSHSVTTSKTTSHSSTVAAGHGGYSFPTSKDNRTIHQHVDVTKSSIAQDYSVSRTNAGTCLCLYVHLYHTMGNFQMVKLLLILKKIYSTS